MMKHSIYPILKNILPIRRLLFLMVLVLLGSEQPVLAGSLDPAHLEGLPPEIAAEFSSSPMHQVSRHSRRKSGSRINGVCEGTMSPDQVVISAGLSVESAKPIQGRDALQNQLDEIQGVVKDRGGSVVVLEKVRLIRKLAQPSNRKHKLPYLILQRLEFVFPTSVDIDEVLERLLELGVDRFGKTISPNKTNSNHQVVVYYRFSNLVELLNGIRKDCTVQAVMKWCQHDSPEFPLPECLETGTDLESRFSTISFQLSSQPVMVQGYRSNALSFSYPWQPKRLNKVELFGNISLKLSGKIVVISLME